MQESALGIRLKKTGMFSKLQKLTDKFAVGIPDYLYLLADGRCGLIELKRIARWPVRGGVVDLGMGKEQALYLHSWCRAGGRALLLAQVGVSFVAVPGNRCLELRLGKKREEILEMSVWHGTDLHRLEEHL